MLNNEWNKLIESKPSSEVCEYLMTRYVKDEGTEKLVEEFRIRRESIIKYISRHKHRVNVSNPELCERYKQTCNIVKLRSRGTNVTEVWLNLKKRYPNHVDLAIYLMEYYSKFGNLIELSKSTGVPEAKLKYDYMSKYCVEISKVRPDLYARYLEIKKEHNKISIAAMNTDEALRKKRRALKEIKEARKHGKDTRIKDIIESLPQKIEYTKLLDKVAISNCQAWSMQKVLKEVKSRGIEVYYKTESGLKLAR